jgi:hypothetical protein
MTSPRRTLVIAVVGSPRRILGLALIGCFAGGSPASADTREPPVHFELGVNTRRFAASDTGRVALRTSSGSPVETGAPGGTGVTVSLRFTKWMRWGTYAGFEAETGSLMEPSSNFAGAYGLIGARGTVGPIALYVEAAPGKRWIRYEAMGKNYQSYLVETRVRAETWISSRFTFGGAIGATLTGEVGVWMAGLYLGVHSLDFGTR